MHGTFVTFVILVFWALSGLKSAQNEVFQALLKINAWNSFQFLLENTVSWRFKIYCNTHTHTHTHTLIYTNLQFQFVNKKMSE